jgi:hypothetical protein
MVTDPTAAASVRFEDAQTAMQLAKMLMGWVWEGEPAGDATARALAAAERAVDGYTGLEDVDRVAQAHFLAADAEEALGRPDAARTRLRALREAAAQRGDEPTQQQCDAYLRRLNHA